MMAYKKTIKKILGELPLTVEAYWWLRMRNRQWKAHYDLEDLRVNLPEILADVELARAKAPKGKKIFIFASLHYWVEYSAVLALALAGQGHDVSLGFLPYADWFKPLDRFDLRKQNLYTRQVLQPAAAMIKIVPLADIRPMTMRLDEALQQAVKEVSIFDTQYTLQREEITGDEDLYKERLRRNREAALALRAWMGAYKPDLVLLPNGTIQEMGVAYRVARHLDIDAVTFEFGEARQRIWLAKNSEIMQQDTDALWQARGHQPLSPAQREQIEALFSARQNGKTFKNFARKWQANASKGGGAVRKALNLDERPVVLLATNVIGDSLTLGRQVFSDSMSNWIKQTVTYFAKQDRVQLVIRVHPGELVTQGASIVEVLQPQLANLPQHIHLVAADAAVNTYDLMALVNAGLVYTTTVGMEMAMCGTPVIVAGQTHYRKRGFTIDPSSWEDYIASLDALMADLDGARLTEAQVELAWRYAYLFFFEYSQPFPWHLLDLAQDIQTRPMHDVLGEQGMLQYGNTFACLTGKPLDWQN